jgi:hypothetical protein
MMFSHWQCQAKNSKRGYLASKLILYPQYWIFISGQEKGTLDGQKTLCRLRGNIIGVHSRLFLTLKWQNNILRYP